MTSIGRSFVGIDLAWGTSARTGLAVVDDTGRLVRSGSVRTDDEIADWLHEVPGDVVVAAVDAPLIVPNERGQRRCETDISRAFGRFKAGAHSSNRSRSAFAPPRAAVLAERFGWSTDPAGHGSAEAPVCVEVYPHPAMVGLFGLSERVAYKSGPHRAEGFAQLVQHFASIDQLRLGESPRWAELTRVISEPGRGDLTRIEDEMDAILCAHLAWLWHHQADRLTVYGSWEEGYIVAPPPPDAGLDAVAELPPPLPDLVTGPSLEVDVEGRPTGFAGGEHEAGWKLAVRTSFAGKTFPPSIRVALEVDYRLHPSQVGHGAPDLDNLLKSTIDALDEVLGPRPGRFATPQADDERVDRIVASKRVAGPGERPGARIRLDEL